MINKKHIFISIIVGLCQALSIIIGQIMDNLGLWLILGMTSSLLSWFLANCKEFNKKTFNL